MLIPASSCRRCGPKGPTNTSTRGLAVFLLTACVDYSSKAPENIFTGRRRYPPRLPISRLLFVIYVSPLHPVIPKGIVISYVDDFVVTVSSSSHRRNVQLLQGHYSSLCSIAAPRGLTFSVPKTELIHWCTPQERSPPSKAGVRLDDLCFSPKDTVRWLGYWFTPPLSSNAHFSKRLSLAQGAFDTIKRLSPSGKGLPRYLCHRLASSLLAPVLLYGVDLYMPLIKMQDKLDVFWHRVQRG